MLFVGVDPSLTGSGLCVVNHDGVLLHVGTIKSKKDQYPYALTRYLTLSKNILMWIQSHVDGDCLLSIEGYSFGSRGAAVFSLAEFGGILRHTLAKEFKAYFEVPPTVLKKFATGKGNANKNVVLEQVYRKYKVGSEILVDDNQVDAFCLAQFSRGIYFDHDLTFSSKYKYTKTEWVV